jgi:hypothetical protein
VCAKYLEKNVSPKRELTSKITKITKITKINENELKTI